MGENNHHLQEDPPRSNSHSSSQHDHESTSTVANNGEPITRTNSTSSPTPNGVPSSQYTVEYLSQLLKDKKQLAAFPNVFHHVERLVDEEISKVRVALFQFEFSKDQLALPEAEGEVQTVTEKVFVPAKEHPDYNFVGRILGPRGMTAKQLEQETGCKIMVRGRGSMRDKKKEEMNRGKPNWEHLNEELHVLIQCEDTPNRAAIKMLRAVQEVRKLLVPAAEGEDELKRKQLMELAIINGTYRPANQGGAKAPMPTKGDGLISPALSGQLRSPSLAGAPIILSPSGRGAAAAAAAAAVAAAQLPQAHHHHLLAGFPVTNGATNGLQAHHFIQAQQQAQAQQDYANQILLNSMQLDPTTAAALGMGGLQAVNAANYQQYAAAAAMLGAAAQNHQLLGADYSAIDLTGAMLCNQRRILGQTRDHPYQTSGKTSTS